MLHRSLRWFSHGYYVNANVSFISKRNDVLINIRLENIALDEIRLNEKMEAEVALQVVNIK
jgi:hypothetical protein